MELKLWIYLTLGDLNSNIILEIGYMLGPLPLFYTFQYLVLETKYNIIII